MVASEYALLWISIHALRKESDDTSGMKGAYINLFQSTLSVRRATPAFRQDPTAWHFNPRSP